MIVIAWDFLIQLIYFDENEQNWKLDGYYFSDSEINSVYFVGDSLLMVLVN